MANPVPSRPDGQPPTAYPAGQSQQPAAGPSRPIPVASGHPTPAQRPGGQSYPAPQARQPAQAHPTSRPIPVSATASRQPAAVHEEPEDDAEKPVPLLWTAPAWLVSLVVHMLILIVAALLFFTLPGPRAVEIQTKIVEEVEDELDDKIEFAGMDQTEFEEAVVTPEDMKLVDDPLAAPPQLDVIPEATFDNTLTAPTIGMALDGREAGMKKTLLAAYGGNETTEEAVRLGLEWLQRNQKRDGSWSLVGPYQDGGHFENQNAATAMALLAFQGAGHTHQKGAFSRPIGRGWDFLLRQQGKDGNFIPADVPPHHQLYTHAQATIALCELYGMTKDSRYRDAAQKAIDFCADAQSDNGGWRYEPKREGDTSVTGWFVMALQSALMAGLEVPPQTLANISGFLDKVSLDGGRRYKYRPETSQETMALCAEGLLCRQYLGWKQDDPRLVDGINRLVANPIDYSDENVYYWYYATQATHHMEGSAWERWNRVMKEKVPAAQVKDGPERGSWPPDNDEWGARGAGRLYTTCLPIYMLEVYYRHLPIYADIYETNLDQF